jgi:hypothetical protein
MEFDDDEDNKRENELDEMLLNEKNDSDDQEDEVDRIQREL